MKKLLTFALACSTIALMSCGGDDPELDYEIEVPATESPELVSEAGEETGVNKLLSSFGDLMNKMSDDDAVYECAELNDFEAYMGEMEVGMQRIAAGEKEEDVWNKEEMEARGEAIQKELDDNNVLVPGSDCMKKYSQITTRMVGSATEMLKTNPEFQEGMAKFSEVFNSDEMKKLMESDELKKLMESLNDLGQ